MAALNRVLSIYLLLAALAAAVVSVTASLYYEGGGEPFPVWDILSAVMAPGVVIVLVDSFMRKRRFDSAGGDLDARSYLRVNIVFYAAVVLTLWFFRNWMGDLTNTEQDLLVWKLTGPLFAAVAVATALRLWRAEP